MKTYQDFLKKYAQDLILYMQFKKEKNDIMEAYIAGILDGSLYTFSDTTKNIRHQTEGNNHYLILRKLLRTWGMEIKRAKEEGNTFTDFTITFK